MKKQTILLVGLVVVLIFCVTLWGGKADAQEKKYPARPIEVVINFAAGGPTDVWTRIVAPELQKELGTTLSIQYKPGAGGVIGATYVAAQKPDGYNLLSCSVSSLVSAPFMEKDAAYNVLKDFTPIASCIVVPNLLVSNTASKLTSFDVAINLAKEKPGALTCASPGTGTTAQLVIEVLKMHGINLTDVPSKGAAPAVTTLLGQHVDLATIMYSAALPHVKAGAFRVLATTDKVPAWPSVPTYKEKGFPEAESLGSLQGFFAPPNLPKSIQDQIANAVQKALQVPSVKQALEDAGFTVAYLGPDALRKKVAEDYQSIDRVVKSAKLGKYAK